MIKCIIVEDETLAQNVMQAHLQRTEQFQLVAVCSNALEANEVLAKQQVDLMFLDIQLPGMSGLNFLKTLRAAPLVVFTTAYANYALESYDFSVIDYLLKPISFERFSKTVNKIAERKSLTESEKPSDISNNHIFIKSNGKFFKVDFSEIIYIEGMRDYLKIHTQNSTLVTLQTMSEMEKMLPPQQFLRVHKSFIVGLAYIKVIQGNNIEVNKTSIPIGINYKNAVGQLTGKNLQ